MDSYNDVSHATIESTITAPSGGDAGIAKSVFGNRNFLLLWLGQGTSLLGDQFTMIALPWLVLQLTGDPLSLGIVLALEGIPRACFMLVGGAVTDRFSQRSVMLVSDFIRMALIVSLTVLVLTGNVHVWMLYVLALAFGIVSGFFIPASNSIVPSIVQKEELMVCNSVTQGTSQLSVFIGPLLAGGIIALFSGSAAGISGAASGSMTGVGIAFAVDSLTFVASIVTLVMMRVGRPEHSGMKQDDLVRSILEGITFVVKTPKIFYMFLILSALNFLFVGPFMVGIPVISNTRLAEGAAAFGILMAAFGVGNLTGIIASGMLKLKPEKLGIVAVIVTALFGIGLGLIGFITSTWTGAAILAVLGILNGYVGVVLITLMQKNAPPEMICRLMSLAMFAVMGMVPVSQAISGALINISLEGVFTGCGVLILAVSVIAALSKEVRDFGVDSM